ncbi:hypothetical protein KZ810_03040 [Sphingomonas sp. RHCKR47]|nr:hypothetical protein [Sphingomonas citricola]MBW6522461.1 hypothetical protein [Sphingomonas citricola]
MPRARQEVVSAITAGSAITAAVHQEMCLLHCSRVIAAMLFAGRQRGGAG